MAGHHLSRALLDVNFLFQVLHSDGRVPPSDYESWRKVFLGVWHKKRYNDCYNIFDRVANNAFLPVPVIAVFTKFDALWDDAYEQLKDSGLSRSESKTKAPEFAKAIFAKAKIWDRLCENRYPPKGHVYLAGEFTTHFVWISCNCTYCRNGERPCWLWTTTGMHD